ncbi:restriction endonuclease subunit S [Limosilactobacillus reuteri]|uniref:restriction endonuclease subunit S n=1 Tax=Limosilactobacillus reuteri TaxID=1598 RepID=UPI0025583373|nr:restriction endonuclease subunit S [Limosilactobacillus reuteri]
MFDWEQHKLKTVVSVNSGKDYKSLEKGNIPVYGTGGYITSVSKSLSNQDAVGLGRKGTINKPYILKAPFWTVDTLFYLTLKPENILTFIYSLIQKINWLKYDESTGLPSLSKKNIENVLVYLTKLDEQQKIGKLIVKLDKLITLQQRKLELLKEIKKGLLQKMFADKSNFPILRFEGFHAEWEQRKLGEVIELEDNKRKPVKASKRIPGNIPYYGANGIQDYVKGYTHTGEHVLVAEDGANSISNYPVYFICSPSWINNHSHVLTGKGSIISNKFLTYNLKTVPYANYLVGSGRYKLNAETLKIIPIKLPLLTEQNYIGSTLSKIDKLITLQHQRLSKLNEIKKSLLQQMFI